jgi:formylglycine-generating enzyme required for sulfatase activity
LPSEAEWEYAARGGPAWTDGFTYSGRNDIDEVAWYDRNSGHTAHPVAEKAPNQLGLFDMSGNVWEWCHDHFTRDVSAIPRDSTPFAGPSERRILRGGCSHNWAIHCTVAKRYEIDAAHGDSDIGFRLAY